MIPVENKDIWRARNLRAAKCSELKKEHQAPGKENDSTILFQSRVCSDIALFIEDLEQMFHLIQRQGIAADYLLLLGTFSKIIHDEMSSTLSVQYI